MTTIAVLLAAGGGSRFGGATHKLLADAGGIAVWRRSLDHALGSGLATIVVTGAVDLDVPPGASVVHNPDWADGQATSLQAGLHAAADAGAQAVVVGLADQPAIPASAWRAVAGAPESPIVIATYGGVPGPNPVRLDRSVWPLLPRSGDLGARRLIAEHPDWVIKVACIGSAHDIDTLEDLDRWRSC